MLLPLNFLRLPSSERRLLLWSLAVVAAARLGLSALRYERMRRLIPGGATEAAPADLARRTAWAVTRAAKWVPGATCLTQAFACQWLLARQGYASTIRIGVAEGGARAFRAHAWLVSGGRTVIGDAGRDLSGFAVLAELTSGAS